MDEMIPLEFQLVDKGISNVVDGTDLYITGIANSGQEDLVGDIVTQQALEQICADAPNHNLHLDHDTEFGGIIGTITDAEIVDAGVEIRARILDERRASIESLLNQGVKLGLSVAGLTRSNDDNPSLIDEWVLTEISLTPIPCDQSTMGTVHIAKSLKQLLDDIGKSKSETVTEPPETEDEDDDDDDGVVSDDSTNNEASQDDVDNKNDDGGQTMAEENFITEDAVIELINTAFAEKHDEFLEAIRGELKDEYEAKLNAQEERIASIESQIEALKEPAEPAEPVEEEEKEEPEEEVVEPVAPEEDEEDEEEKIEKAVTHVLAKIFGVTTDATVEAAPSEPSFRYEDKSGEHVETEKKGYTPRELAEIMAKQ